MPYFSPYTTHSPLSFSPRLHPPFSCPPLLPSRSVFAIQPFVCFFMKTGILGDSFLLLRPGPPPSAHSVTATLGRLHTCMPFTLPQLPIPPTPPSLAFLPSYAATLPNFATGRSVPRLTPSTPGRHGRASTASYWGGPPRLFTHPCYAPRLP